MTMDDKGAKDAAASTDAANAAELAQALREHAEVLARSQSALAPGRPAGLAPAAARDVLHELQVHQIELEMQNDELRRAQLELDASRARYFNLYDLAPVGYCSISEQGLILQANLAAATLLGTTRSALVKQPFSRFIAKADQDTWYLHRKMLVETRHAQALELRLAPPDGALLWVQVAASIANDGSGAPVILAVLTDVSNRKLLEMAMRESEARFRALVEWSPEAMLVHGGGRVIYANPAAVKIMRARAVADLLGKPFLDLIHPASQPTVLAGLKSVAGPDGTPVTGMHCLTLDGGLVTVEARSIATTYDGRQAIITCLHEVEFGVQPDGASPAA